MQLLRALYWFIFDLNNREGTSLFNYIKDDEDSFTSNDEWFMSDSK